MYLILTSRKPNLLAAKFIKKVDSFTDAAVRTLTVAVSSMDASIIVVIG